MFTNPYFRPKSQNSCVLHQSLKAPRADTHPLQRPRPKSPITLNHSEWSTYQHGWWHSPPSAVAPVETSPLPPPACRASQGANSGPFPSPLFHSSAQGLPHSSITKTAATPSRWWRPPMEDTRERGPTGRWGLALLSYGVEESFVMLIIHSESLSGRCWLDFTRLYGFYPKDRVRHQEENPREDTCLQRDVELLYHKTWNNGFNGMESYSHAAIQANHHREPKKICIYF